MNASLPSGRRLILPAAVFAGVGTVHFIWSGLFPEQSPLQDQWVTIPVPHAPSWTQRYVETQSYWLGLSYALSLAFAAAALRRYREQRFCASRTLAIGGATFSGFLAVAGCYLLGCCGSPMLAVYLSLFGAAFLPLAKPLTALMTVVLVGGSWWWINRVRRGSQPLTAS
jgi:hypothetical protein